MENLDANKTALTHNITAVAMGYLDGAGFKPIETEVTVAGGWIADIASFVYPTPTETKKLKINHRFDGGKLDNLSFSEIQYRYGFLLTAVVEVKISKADFQKDIQRKFNGIRPAHLLYIAYPSGVIDDDEIPAGWMGLKCSKNGQKLIKRVGWPKVHAMNPGDITDLVAEVAIRRDHKTRYGHYRSMMKMYRAEEKEKKKSYQLANVIQTIAAWIRGDYNNNRFSKRFYPDLKTILEGRDINCPKYVKDDLEYLNNLNLVKSDD